MLTGIGASVLLADLVYNVPANVIVDSARRALTGYDVFTSMVKSWVFGSVVAMVSVAMAKQTDGNERTCLNRVWDNPFLVSYNVFGRSAYCL